MSKVQSIIFERDLWSVTSAKNWLNEHGYISPKVDTTSNYLRFRQRKPQKGANYATKNIGNGISLIIYS